MADIRIPSGAQALTPAAPAQRSEAVRAAQRAFFNAALNQAQVNQTPAATPIRRQTEAMPQAASAPLRMSEAASSNAPPDRILRPGSLLDIKV